MCVRCRKKKQASQGDLLRAAAVRYGDSIQLHRLLDYRVSSTSEWSATVTTVSSNSRMPQLKVTVISRMSS